MTEQAETVSVDRVKCPRCGEVFAPLEALSVSWMRIPDDKIGINARLNSAQSGFEYEVEVNGRTVFKTDDSDRAIMAMEVAREISRNVRYAVAEKTREAGFLLIQLPQKEESDAT